MDFVSIALASAIPIVLAGGLLQRIYYYRKNEQGVIVKKGLGIGWQFIRFVVLATGFTIIALLALKGFLTSEITTLFASAMGFAFGKSGNDA